MSFHEILQEVQGRGEGVRHGLPQMQTIALHLWVGHRRARKTSGPSAGRHANRNATHGRPEASPIAERSATVALAPPRRLVRPSAPTFTLAGQIAELEVLKQKNLNRGRNLGILSLLVALAIVILIYSVYSRTVLAYAILENIEIEQDPVVESQDHRLVRCENSRQGCVRPPVRDRSSRKTRHDHGGQTSAYVVELAVRPQDRDRLQRRLTRRLVPDEN